MAAGYPGLASNCGICNASVEQNIQRSCPTTIYFFTHSKPQHLNYWSVETDLVYDATGRYNLF